MLDPAVGDGIFLAEMLRAEAATGGGCGGDLFGVDIQSSAVAAARRRLPGAGITVGNFLVDELPGPGRYDLIVGNPPYLGQRDVSRLAYAPVLFERYGMRDDLYVYFLHRCLDVLADGGVLAMVTSDSWLTLAGKEPIRRRLLEYRIDHVIRLPAGTFDRRISACCFALIHGAQRGKVWVTDAPTYRAAAPEFRPRKGYRVRQSLYLDAPRAVVFEPTRDHLDLQASLGSTLARWVSGEVEAPQEPTAAGRGDLVPLETVARISDVGVHSRNCRHRMFFAEEARPGLHRLLQGRQIQRWRVCWDSPNARYRWVDVAYRPRPGVKGVGRGGAPSRRDEYWDFQGDPAIHRLPERILVRQTGDEIVAALLRQAGTVHYTDNTLFTCLLSETGRAWGLSYFYLLGYLNSSAAGRIYRFLSQEGARRQAQVKIRLLRVLPFRRPGSRDVARIGALVGRIMRAHQRGRADAAVDLVAACDAHFERLLLQR